MLIGLRAVGKRFARMALSIPAWVVQWPFVRFLGSRQLLCQPIFIIGAPRTGSTILYQALSDYYKVAYIDNLACRLHGALFTGMILSRLLFGSRPHGNFKSRHGDTLQYGLHAPSECGGFWYRWLPKNRHFVDHPDISPSMTIQIRRELSAVINAFGEPLLVKNMNAGQRLRLIQKVFPGAKLIYLRRRHPDIVRSIKAVRVATGTPQGELWSILPRNHAQLAALPEEEMIAGQIVAIEAQIEEDLALFPPDNVVTIRYEDFSEELVLSLGGFLGAEVRPGGRIPDFDEH